MQPIKMEGFTAPEELTYNMKHGCRVYTLSFDIRPFEMEGYGLRYSWTEVRFDIRRPTYGEIVSAIVRGRYTANEMESVTNNYLDNPDDENIREWREMQAWRKEAKSLAKSVLARME